VEGTLLAPETLPTPTMLPLTLDVTGAKRANLVKIASRMGECVSFGLYDLEEWLVKELGLILAYEVGKDDDWPPSSGLSSFWITLGASGEADAELPGLDPSR